MNPSALLPSPAPWLALNIGNSRLHWAAIAQSRLQARGDWPHLAAPATRALFPAPWRDRPLYIVSVVPAQLHWWQAVPHQRVITLAEIPLAGKYETLGCDRALAAWGAMQQYGAPVLVIDGGTALTLTAIDATGSLVGGAILPGLSLQLRSLAAGTAALPHLTPPTPIAPLWGMSTAAAMQSGVGHGLAAAVNFFVHRWQQDYPHSAIVLTGGDGAWLQTQIHQAECQLEPDLVIRGLIALWEFRGGML